MTPSSALSGPRTGMVYCPQQMTTLSLKELDSKGPRDPVLGSLHSLHGWKAGCGKASGRGCHLKIKVITRAVSLGRSSPELMGCHGTQLLEA